MIVPNGDDRYFTMGVDQGLFDFIPIYAVEEYDEHYPRILQRMPERFSITLREEIVRFVTSVPPSLHVEVADVIDLACYYYCDWESVVAVTDEFLSSRDLESLRQDLRVALSDPKRIEEQIQEQLIMLTGALQKLIGTVISVLQRFMSPAVSDFGSVYRLADIWDNGLVVFQMCNPTQIHGALEDAEGNRICHG
jgi:hypothetical protein